MKNTMKTMLLMGVTALVAGGGAYIMQNEKLRNKTGKAVLKAMDNAEDMISKKIN